VSFVDDINPATGELLARVPVASGELADRAIASAAEAQAKWARLTGTERGRRLCRAADLLRDQNDRLAAMEVRDTGKPIQEADCVDVQSGADCLEYFGRIIAGHRSDYIPLGENYAYTRHEPLGVCAGIGAWNYPLQIACWKAGPALAAGNAMVYKPSEMTPLTSVELGKVFKQAGIPDGLFQVLHGDGELGRHLTTHPGIAKVSLTGSVGTGKRVMAGAADTMKHVSLELGGKSPILIFADADLTNAVSGAMLGNFYTQGEVCSNGTRVFVERSIAPAFLEQLLVRTARLRIGDPMDPETQVGSLISEDHLRSVLDAVESGRREGATVLCGGEREPGLPGAFMQPTVLGDCRDDMAVMRNEIFGPVMCVTVFDDEAEAIQRANATDFGLAAGVFSRDLSRAHRVTTQLQAGTCWVNTYNITPIEMPFGAYKHSGIGRENGWEALSAYTQVKSVYVETGDVDCPYS